MNDETLRQIETRIQNSTQVPPASKAELLELIAQLRAELSAFSREDPERAERLSRQIDATARRVGGEGESEPMHHGWGELSGGLSSFEKAHPQLVDLINRVSTTLANMGI